MGDTSTADEDTVEIDSSHVFNKLIFFTLNEVILTHNVTAHPAREISICLPALTLSAPGRCMTSSAPCWTWPC